VHSSSPGHVADFNPTPITKGQKGPVPFSITEVIPMATLEQSLTAAVDCAPFSLFCSSQVLCRKALPSPSQSKVYAESLDPANPHLTF
jgi:hypothetical protein